MTKTVQKTCHIVVTGLVQGVGFRPFVYRLAQRFMLTGRVENTNENVQIDITGDTLNIELFLQSLKSEAPPASRIEAIMVTESAFEKFADFSIRHSRNVSDEITEISPDIAVCSECMEDIAKAGTRFNYPFVNCTHCGPRFTIIQDLPYDREKTTMRSFKMCGSCNREYQTITDRRFHAQPTACEVCGPRYELIARNQEPIFDTVVILRRLALLLEKGGVVLMKGLGGMHIACDAFNVQATEKLRHLKKRDAKPFAVMFRDIGSLQQHVMIDETEKASLLSPRRPIVLLQVKPASEAKFAKNINSGLNLLGVLLPYMPFHYQLFQHLKTEAIVLTSGNFSSEPILIDNQEAVLKFSDYADAILLHNRDIFNRSDDSVVRISAGKERVFRRSRGYVPTPLHIGLNTDGILGFGAELTNCFCLGKGNKAILSQHIGDLQGVETTLFYEQTMAQFLKLFRVKPALLAVDMHPNYISTRTAEHFSGIPVVQVQHHHAHVAACMAEHNLDEKVIGVAFDGTGYGDDGNTWGSEFFVCDLNDYERVTHFDYIGMPGGDSASEEPWRMAVAWLYRVYGPTFKELPLSLFSEIEPGSIEVIIRMIDRQINTPLTCGAGRLFDAVSSIMGLCHKSTFQAEAPMRLESMVTENCSEPYPFEQKQTLFFDVTIKAIVDDLTRGVDLKIIASKFHNTIISVIFEAVNKIRQRNGICKVVLSGGVFQNKYLLEGTIIRLRENNFEVYAHVAVPSNDGGIALGQTAVAAKRRSLKCV